jgi:GNAT superfamily N-acetyltransferase
MRDRLLRRGIGSRLMELVEVRAREMGAAELALDTSERANDLITMYEPGAPPADRPITTDVSSCSFACVRSSSSA